MHQIEILQHYPGTIDLASLQNLLFQDLKFPRVDVAKKVFLDLNSQVVTIGRPGELEKEDLEIQARELIPWKKGPFSLFGHLIDAEWRSDIKWSGLLLFSAILVENMFWM